MADIETQLSLERDEAEVIALLTDHAGGLARDATEAGVYWLTLRPLSVPEERFHVRISWRAYPHSPPSVRFADQIGGSLTVTAAWPMIPGYRPGSFDICRPFTAEGYALHPEWANGGTAWPTEGNPFLWVVETMQFHLDNEYQGRSA